MQFRCLRNREGNKIWKVPYCLEKMRIERRTSYMQSMQSTELHLLIWLMFFSCLYARCICDVYLWLKSPTLLGDAGDWTQDLIHAKHALYHWATSPDLDDVFLLFKCYFLHARCICDIYLRLKSPTLCGDAGNWTQDLIHAKHALYHWATSPHGDNCVLFFINMCLQI